MSGCVLFFDDSLTFGEGVNDNQTMPYRVGMRSAGALRVYNFAFHGYGPHQMLAQIELGVVRDTIDCLPDHAIYQAIIPRIADYVVAHILHPVAPRKVAAKQAN